MTKGKNYMEFFFVCLKTIEFFALFVFEVPIRQGMMTMMKMILILDPIREQIPNQITQEVMNILIVTYQLVLYRLAIYQNPIIEDDTVEVIVVAAADQKVHPHLVADREVGREGAVQRGPVRHHVVVPDHLGKQNREFCGN